MSDRSKPPEQYWPQKSPGKGWDVEIDVPYCDTEGDAVMAAHEHADHQRAIGYEQGKADGAREALEKARDATCVKCEHGERLSRDGLHDTDGIIFDSECPATAIRDLLATTTPKEPT